MLYGVQDSVNKVLLNNSALVEDYLQRATSGQTKAGLTVDLKTLEEFDPAQSSLAPETIAWMKKNIGFTANRRELC